MDIMDKLGAGLVLFLGAMVVLGIVALAGFDSVDANHLGVKIKLGENAGVMRPGYAWTGLFTKVYEYDLRTRKNIIDMSGSNSAVDKTGQAVFATININYRVKPTPETVQKLYNNVGTNEIIADVLNIDAIVSEGFKQATVKYDALEILDKRQEVKELAKENIRSNFPAEYFEIQDIIITNIDFSEKFKEAIENKKTAEQEALKEQNQLEVVKFQQQQEIAKFQAEAERLKLQKEEINELLIKKAWVDKWDGQLPLYMLTPTDNQEMMMVLPSMGDE